ISGRRRSDWVKLPKFKVDRTAGTVRFSTHKRKEKGEITLTLTPRELQIIREEWDKAPGCEHVFTYEARQEKDKRGEGRPITVAGLRRATDRAFAAAGIHDFRRHDFRHTFASRFGRATGDLRKLQVALDHQDIASTVKYRHVTETEVTEARANVTVLRP